MHGRNTHVLFSSDWDNGPLTDCILGVEEECVDLYTESERSVC